MGQVLQTEDWNAAKRIQDAKLGELGFTAICLAPGEKTPGHSHTLVEELTVFRAGTGTIQIENDTIDVCAGSVSVVPAGEFHRICNTGTENLEAVVVFNSNIDRDKVELKTRKQHFGKKKSKNAKAAGELRAKISSIGDALESLEKELSALES